MALSSIPRGRGARHGVSPPLATVTMATRSRCHGHRNRRHDYHRRRGVATFQLAPLGLLLPSFRRLPSPPDGSETARPLPTDSFSGGRAGNGPTMVAAAPTTASASAATPATAAAAAVGRLCGESGAGRRATGFCGECRAPCPHALHGRVFMYRP